MSCRAVDLGRVDYDAAFALQKHEVERLEYAALLHDIGRTAIRREVLVKSGKLGRKSGSGFYRYQGGKKAEVDESVYAMLGIARDSGPGEAEITERLSLALLNEAVRALEEQVIRQPRDGDIGAIFGFGYPPFRGGPFRTIDAMGPANVLAMLERLSARFGARFAPATMLIELARNGGRFYPES